MPSQSRAITRSRGVRALVTVLVLAVVGYFFGRSLAQNWDAVRQIDFTVDGWSVVAVVLFALAVPVSGLLWGRMTAELSGTDVQPLEAVRVHCLSWLLKYVPGQVGSAVNKVAWAAGRGLSKTLVLITFVYENAFLLIGSLVPTTLVLLLAGTVDLGTGRAGSTPLLLAFASLIPLLALTNGPVFRFGSNLLARRALHREIPAEYFLRWTQALRYQLLYLLPRVINGAGFVAIAVAMVDVAPSAYLPLACAYIIAGAVGILAVFVPSGLGVRESVLVLLAAAYLPTEQAIVLALVARLYATVADAVVVAVYGILRLTPRKETATS